MKIQVIKDDMAYEAALARVDELFDLKVQKNTELGDELELLLLVIKEYEDKNYPIAVPDPIEVIKLKMQENSMKNYELGLMLGNGKSYISQILNKRKPLTAEMMRVFHHKMGIPAKVLLA